MKFSYARLKGFYSLPQNTIDVMFIGTSHVYDTFLPTILWEQLGITSYNLAQQEQPLECSYFYIKELLKTQMPKLIVLDTLSAYWPKYFKRSSIIHMSIDYLKPSSIKYSCAKKIVPYDKRKQFFADISQKLGNGDVKPKQSYEEYLDITTFSLGDFYSILLLKDFQALLPMCLYRTFKKKYKNFWSPFIDIPKNNIKIINKIIKLAQKNNIELLFVKTPYDKSCGTQLSNKGIKHICCKNNLKYLEFNDHLDDMNINSESDFLDLGHLNFKGARKATNYLAKYIKDSYNNIIENKKNNPVFDIWNKYSKYFNTLIENTIQNNIYLDKIDNGKKIFFEDLSLYEKYNINISSLYNGYAALNSSIKTSIETKDLPIFKIDYIVYPHNNSRLMRIIPDYISNWSDMTGIEMIIMTTDSTNNTKFLIRDKNNLHWSISKKLSTQNYQLVRLPFCEFENFENKPNAQIDLSRIKFLSIIIECPENIDKSCGSVFIKQLHLY